MLSFSCGLKKRLSGEQKMDMTEITAVKVLSRVFPAGTRTLKITEHSRKGYGPQQCRPIFSLGTSHLAGLRTTWETATLNRSNCSYWDREDGAFGVILSSGWQEVKENSQVIFLIHEIETSKAKRTTLETGVLFQREEGRTMSRSSWWGNDTEL